MNGKYPPPKLKVDLKQAINMECEVCQNDHFEPAFIIKIIPPLISPTGQEMIVPIQVFKCDKCNHVNELFFKEITN